MDHSIWFLEILLEHVASSWPEYTILRKAFVGYLIILTFNFFVNLFGLPRDSRYIFFTLTRVIFFFISLSLYFFYLFSTYFQILIFLRSLLSSDAFLFRDGQHRIMIGACSLIRRRLRMSRISTYFSRLFFNDTRPYFVIEADAIKRRYSNFSNRFL